jgi:hypothetical protein
VVAVSFQVFLKDFQELENSNTGMCLSFSLELKRIFVFVLPKFKKIFVNILNLIIIIFALSSQLKKHCWLLV